MGWLAFLSMDQWSHTMDLVFDKYVWWWATPSIVFIIWAVIILWRRIFG